VTGQAHQARTTKVSFLHRAALGISHKRGKAKGARRTSFTIPTRYLRVPRPYQGWLVSGLLLRDTQTCAKTATKIASDTPPIAFRICLFIFLLLSFLFQPRYFNLLADECHNHKKQF